MRVIATVMGEPDSSTRNSEVSSMLDYAYSQVGIKTILKNGCVFETEMINYIDGNEKRLYGLQNAFLIWRHTTAKYTTALSTRWWVS